MASSSATTSKSSNSENCYLCSSKHNRTRASFCQCQHCSIPLCFDCMKQHHDELLQDVEQISHQYNELRELVHSKQTMIDEDAAKCATDVNQYFDNYIDQLRVTQKKILEEIEIAKQQAHNQVQKLDADLRTIGGKIQGLAKEGSVQTAKMKATTSDLEQIQQQLTTFQVIRTDNLFATQPDFSIKFDSMPVESKISESTEMEVNEPCRVEPKQSVPTFGFFSTMCSSSVEQKPLNVTKMQSIKKKKNNDDSDSSESNDDDSDSNCSHIDTSYDVDRMASDGDNLLYTTYYDDEADRIAYCCVDDDDDDEDYYRHWNYSRIVDMIWWNNIRRFVCATKNGIYTVEYALKKFRINEVIRGKWSYVRVAANSTQLCAWVRSAKNDFHGIEIYSPQFQPINKIDLAKYRNELFVNDSVSFCVTDDLIASLYSRMQNNRKILEVTFCDTQVKKTNSITLDECTRCTEIRTNGKDRFFISTGRHSFHIVSRERLIQTIELQNNGRWIGIFDDEQVGVSDGRCDIQLVSYANLTTYTTHSSSSASGK